jgi:hypothetical protein
MYDLSVEDKIEIESNILNFKKQKFDDFIESALVLGELAKMMKYKKTNIFEKMDKMNPIWVRLMSEKSDEVLFILQELIYQINQSENFLNKENINQTNNIIQLNEIKIPERINQTNINVNMNLYNTNDVIKLNKNNKFKYMDDLDDIIKHICENIF